MTQITEKQRSNHRVFPGLVKDGLPFIAGGIALTGLSALADPRLAIAPLALTGLITYFFRDPERAQPTDLNYLYAPADGHVMLVEEIEEDRFIHGPAYRVAIFLSLFNVHVNRSPVDGVVRYLEHVPGTFHAAWRKESEPGNERQYVGMDTDHGPLVVMQVAGLLARRIVCWPQIGDELVCGERFGMIKFSSRTDLIFPRSVARPIVQPGMPVKGGITPLGAYL
ncbi:MAG TPA: phosphatidylserine decarboxylase [Armatimonadota bacterium]|nr:phosphatidylserine decarboxylase [Armatimonadota bacterium]